MTTMLISTWATAPPTLRTPPHTRTVLRLSNTGARGLIPRRMGKLSPFSFPFMIMMSAFASTLSAARPRSTATCRLAAGGCYIVIIMTWAGHRHTSLDGSWGKNGGMSRLKAVTKVWAGLGMPSGIRQRHWALRRSSSSKPFGTCAHQEMVGQRQERAGAEHSPRLADPKHRKRPRTDPTLSASQPRQHTDAIEIKAPLAGELWARRCGRGDCKPQLSLFIPGRVKRLEAKRIALEPVPSLTIARDRETVRTRSQKIFDNLHCTWALKSFCAVWLLLTREKPQGGNGHTATSRNPSPPHQSTSDNGQDPNFLTSISFFILF